MKVGRLFHRKTSGRARLTGIAAIYKVSLSGAPQLIGSGFWVTDQGHLVTAWHVIEDNIGDSGIDSGPIYAIQARTDGSAVARVFRKTHKHTSYDLALSETQSPFECPTEPIAMTLDHPPVGSAVYTHAFTSLAKSDDHQLGALPTAVFNATLYMQGLNLVYQLSYGAALSFGSVSSIFDKARDSVMLPFPCFESTITLFGANSGGPVFDRFGRICGVNCSGISGTNVSYHLPLSGVLDLYARDIELSPEDPVPRFRSVAELGMNRRALFDPPLERMFLKRWQFILVRIIRYLEAKFGHQG